MENYSFEMIKEAIYTWSQNDILKYMEQQDEIQLARNSDNFLLYDLTFSNCLAQISISNPFFAPFQFVAFEAMTLDSVKAQYTGKPELVYFFYDSSVMTIKTVINELEIGIRYCSCYIPDELRSKFLNKRGTVTIEYENLCHIVHPDDIKKIRNRSVDGEFVCKDVEAQYLVVNNNKFSIRILPKIFGLVC